MQLVSFALAIVLGATPSRGQEGIYRTNYRGRAQLILDFACSGPLPAFEVRCGSVLKILGTSDSSITCTQPSQDMAVCENSCTDRAACDDIFYTAGEPGEGSFAEISFHCESTGSLDGLAASFTAIGKPGYECSDESPSSNSRIFNVVQLGAFSLDRKEFNYQDFHFECGTGSSTRNYEGQYSCISGYNCDGFTCERDLDSATVRSDIFRLTEEFITLVDNTPLPKNALVPPILERPPGTYSARFQTNWELSLDKDCTGKYPKISIECTNGVITSLSPLHDSTNCSIVSANTAECTEPVGDDKNFIGSFNGVAYTCTSESSLPTVRSIYPAYNVTCYDEDFTFYGSSNGNFQKLQMGLFCGDKLVGDDFWFWNDRVFECEIGDGFAIESGRYSCHEYIDHPRDGSAQMIDETVMFSDHAWPNIGGTNCFSYSPAPGFESKTGEILLDPESTEQRSSKTGENPDLESRKQRSSTRAISSFGMQALSFVFLVFV